MNRARLQLPPSLRAVLVAGAAGLAAALAGATSADDAERARLNRERSVIDAQYEARQTECSQRFVVTSCIEDAKRERRLALDALRARQITLDESRRKERSAARRSELAVNAADAAKREAVRASRPVDAASQPLPRRDDPTRSLEPRQPAAERAALAKRQVGAGDRASGPKGGGADRTAREGRSRATFEARKLQAAEHREEVIDRTIRRMQQHPAAAALPVPAAVRAP